VDNEFWPESLKPVVRPDHQNVELVESQSEQSLTRRNSASEAAAAPIVIQSGTAEYTPPSTKTVRSS